MRTTSSVLNYSSLVNKMWSLLSDDNISLWLSVKVYHKIVINQRLVLSNPQEATVSRTILSKMMNLKPIFESHNSKKFILTLKSLYDVIYRLK